MLKLSILAVDDSPTITAPWTDYEVYRMLADFIRQGVIAAA
jgi:hypothetical protein